MAYDAFDDQYEGCSEEMEKKAPQLLKEELEANKHLEVQWEEAKKRWKEIKNTISSSRQLNDFHGTAIVAYTGPIYEEFNKAVREFRQNSQYFQFKALHYYLTRAIQILQTGECYTVYRGCETKFYYNGLGDILARLQDISTEVIG
ncbi:PREDICTED: T-cell ecto-ADP-ribosyltransferase 1-like [Elephantulus edwardii]|uniref:T-cell ecto-ADP-ribosyltransferase 1-like n=1 Tax=Elephantulus edwardii TaxID=28737 RepID=UPI0003F05F4D|nr:PREDICTED: T-cell ecto-ADP-ribosyltransferase 1-like [Elephantulus edwardii]